MAAEVVTTVTASVRQEIALVNQTPQRSFFRQWCAVTLGAACAVSVADALLLQRSRSLFTGGFLSVDHLDSSALVVAFLLLSLLLDAALAGVLAGAVMWPLARLGMRSAPVSLVGFLAATAPLAVTDIVSYRLLTYLGPGFDLGLMFDLAGRSLAELFAVSSTQVVSLLVAIAVAGIFAAGALWLVSRRATATLVRPRVRFLLVPLLLLIVAAVALTATVSASPALANGLLRKPSGEALRAAIAAATDVDGDGYSALSTPSDPDPRNAAVFPYAVDVPGNGVDEDGVGGDLAVDASYTEREISPQPWAQKPDVLLVVLESFRADVVGSHYGGKAVTPVMDALAARGAGSTQAYSPNGYTVQSRFHLLAGRLIARRRTPTLIDDFKANGYVVGYFSGQDESFGTAEYRVGFDRADVAFDARSDADKRNSTFTTPGSLAVPLQVVQSRVRQFLDARAGDARPTFLYVNFEDSHFPYTHDGIQPIVSDVRLTRDRIAPGERDALWATYVNTAANIDRAIGDLVESVRRVRGREPAIIITGDHGESLFEYGFLGHGYALNDVQTRVPLIAANLPARIAEPFSLVDLRAMVNDALGVPAGQPAAPVVVPSEKEVFQYLGDVRRPRQIAFVRGGKRFTYDFRTRQVQPWHETWKAPADLQSAERDDFSRLLTFWERINLAAARARNETVTQ